MWIGGYDDWTPAEQREWDRDLEALEREHDEKERQVKEEQNEQTTSKDVKDMKEQNEKACETKTWMDWAFEDPLYKATFTRLGETNAYAVYLIDQTPVYLDVPRNLIFEVVNPLYQGLDVILNKQQDLSAIKIHVYYTCYCTPDTWSYTTMDEILEALNDQLTMKQNLNRGLLLQLSFIKKSS